MSLKQFILAATVATSALSAQASNTFKPEEISRSDPRFSGICEQVSKNATNIIEWKNACEVSTDGGKTWIKAAGGASILAAIGIGALIRIRKKKEEKGEIKKEDDSISLREDTTPFHEETHGEDEEDNDIDKDGEIVNGGDDLTIDILAEAEVYAAYGRYGQAAELLQEEVRKNPENTNAYLKLAGVYKQMKEAAKAVIDKNPTIKDSGLLKELSSFERSLSESELKKLIETAEIRNITENEVTTQEGFTTEYTGNPEPVPIVITEPETIITEEELLIEQPVVITHNKPEPTHITPTEDTFPEPKPPVQAKFASKNQGKLGIDKAVIARLDSLGFGIEKSEDGNSATITVLKEGVSLRYIEVGTNEPQSINQGEKYTITNATGIFYTNRSGDPTLMVRQRSGKDRYIQIIIEKK